MLPVVIDREVNILLLRAPGKLGMVHNLKNASVPNGKNTPVQNADVSTSHGHRYSQMNNTHFKSKMASVKAATVEEASPSLPPLPSGPLPTQEAPIAELINFLGEDDSEDERPKEDGGHAEDGAGENEEEWDPSAERLPGEGAKGKGKEKASSEGGASGGEGTGENAHPWQAVWSPEKNGESSFQMSLLLGR